ncbi:MAG: VOC family protein [Pirellulales bacterium]|nr:VOC family protein [Pirellulales bacterium]
MGNPFCHCELNANDLDVAREFYGKLFDWKIEGIQMPDRMYYMIHAGEGTGGGIMQNPMPNVPSFWLSYVLVDDLKAATDKARKLGATIMLENHPAGDFGSLTIFTDPQGAVLGLWQPKER